MASNVMTLTILDMPEILEILHECLQSVPDWERKKLEERLELVLARAREHRSKE